MYNSEVLLVPVFMLADYYLTILGVTLAERKYGRHLKVEYYELNPLFQKTVAAKRWFSARHLGATVMVSGVLIYSIGFEPADWQSRFLLGYIFAVYALVLGRHCSNLLLFSYLTKRPDSIVGEVAMDQPLRVSLSLYQLFPTLLLMIMLVIYVPSPSVVGAGLGVATLLGVHFLWRWRASRRKRQ